MKNTYWIYSSNCQQPLILFQRDITNPNPRFANRVSTERHKEAILWR